MSMLTVAVPVIAALSNITIFVEPLQNAIMTVVRHTVNPERAVCEPVLQPKRERHDTKRFNDEFSLISFKN